MSSSTNARLSKLITQIIGNVELGGTVSFVLREKQACNGDVAQANSVTGENIR